MVVEHRGARGSAWVAQGATASLSGVLRLERLPRPPFWKRWPSVVSGIASRSELAGRSGRTFRSEASFYQPSRMRTKERLATTTRPVTHGQAPRSLPRFVPLVEARASPSEREASGPQTRLIVRLASWPES